MYSVLKNALQPGKTTNGVESRRPGYEHTGSDERGIWV